MKEWSKENEYCSFNSWKGLSYIEHYNAIVQDRLLSPIEASLDPTSLCQLSCQWCNSYSFLQPEGSLYNNMRIRKYPSEHLEKLVKFLIDWGVRSFCFGGGGEPSLNDEVRECMKLICNEQKEFSLVTNGIYISNQLLSLLPLCRWIGVSVDVGKRKTYQQLKGIDKFDTVLKNIERIKTGEFFLGSEALELGLIDKLGNLQTAIDDAKSIANIEDPKIVQYEEKKDLFIDKETYLLKEHSRALSFIGFLFLGFTISFAFWYVVLPNALVTDLFNVQTQTITTQTITLEPFESKTEYRFLGDV